MKMDNIEVEIHDISHGNLETRVHNMQAIECQPIAAITDRGIALGIISEDIEGGELYVINESSLRVIAAYRAMQIFNRLETSTTDNDLDNCLAAGVAEITDKEAMAMVEQRIGREEYIEILASVPDNINTILEELGTDGVHFDLDEIAEEVELGTFEPSEYVQQLLEYKRKEDTALEFGIVVPTKQAESIALEQPGDTSIISTFLYIHQQSTRDNRKAFVHRSRGEDEEGKYIIESVYIIGKHKEIEGIEITLGSITLYRTEIDKTYGVEVGYPTNAQLYIGLDQGSDAMAYEPVIYEMQATYTEQDVVEQIRQKFPLFNLDHEVRIFPIQEEERTMIAYVGPGNGLSQLAREVSHSLSEQILILASQEATPLN